MSGSLRRAFAALRKARLVGYASACFCMLAVFFLIDGLQMLMRSDFNRVDLVLGEEVFMSGAMPLQAKSHEDIVVLIEGLDGLSFTPITDFKGLWFGAHMWRATLDARAASASGRAMLTVLDLVPAKSTTSNATIMVQNPTQVYAITVWPSKDEMRAAHLSFSHRVTGLSAFIIAGLSVACGIGLGVVNLLLNITAHKALAQEGIFVIHGMRQTDAGYQAIFSPGIGRELLVQQPVSLLNPEGVEQRKGLLEECAPSKCIARFSLDGVPPGYGWLLRYEPGAKTAPASEALPATEKGVPG